MEYILSAITDIGIKKDTNQDSYYAMVADTAWGRIAFGIVCDGMVTRDRLAAALRGFQP